MIVVVGGAYEDWAFLGVFETRAKAIKEVDGPTSPGTPPATWVTGRRFDWRLYECSLDQIVERPR